MVAFLKIEQNGYTDEKKNEEYLFPLADEFYILEHEKGNNGQKGFVINLGDEVTLEYRKILVQGRSVTVRGKRFEMDGKEIFVAKDMLEIN